ncbi:hypothetical protein F5B22DRAFT_620000 [Xylaria bambusicola]|uniref:uncharacterized protein n=1 Tax=Xylaria bambusicola TaxID=326684 RepID=UPI0020075AE7|nr:uncharacterized protein F5B22DRAFT_620000 [Xylaria bambusicola]KAI0508696.1 hypothetical protein F5B22DRAFT_620000 [Xylaria bambusicola]
MPFLSTPLTLAATGGILGSAWISGGNASLSFAAIPAILQSGASTDGLVRAWYTQFSRSLYIPVIGVVTGLNYFHLAYRHHALGREWRGFAAAGLANVVMVPFTLLFIGGINNTLMAARKCPLPSNCHIALFSLVTPEPT